MLLFVWFVRELASDAQSVPVTWILLSSFGVVQSSNSNRSSYNYICFHFVCLSMFVQFVRPICTYRKPYARTICSMLFCMHSHILFRSIHVRLSPGM